MPDVPVPTAGGVRVLDHAVLRVAAWPIEISDAFTAPALADAARAVLADRADAASASDDPAALAAIDAVADEIHAAVPVVADQATRRWLLAARRALRVPAQVLPAPPTDAPEVLAELPAGPALLASIDAIAAPRAAAADRRAAFSVAIDDELRHQREALRTLGSSDRFRAALAIAEPSVLVRWEATRGKVLTDKARVRRLDATVLHFAMRACGRPTPNGGWSGVAAVRPDDGSNARARTAAEPLSAPEPVLSSEPAIRRVEVSVDLAPFAAVLAAWARALGAAGDHPLRREPTLRDDLGTKGPENEHDNEGESEGGHRWVYLRRDTDPCTFAALATVPELREALDRWPPGAVATPSAFYEHVGEPRGRAIVEHLLACGVLHSGLQLPAFADSPAHALDAVTPLLPEPLATAWSDATAATRDAAQALADAFLADDVAGVVRHRDQIRAVVSTLTEAAGLGEAPDRGLVHLDLGVPWTATWNAAGRAAVGGALDDVFAFHATDGAAEAYRGAMADRVRATATGDVLVGIAANESHWIGPPPSVARRSDLLRSVGVDPEPAEARLTSLLDTDATTGRAVLDLATDPDPDPAATGRAGTAGSFIVGLTSATTWARWGRPQPGMFVTRFAPLLADADAGVGADAVLTDLARALRRIGARRIVGADVLNRNAALRPPLAGLAPWGWTLAGDVTDPADATVVDRDGAAVVSDDDGDGDTFVPVYDSAAVIGSSDPVSRFVRTVAMTHGWELAAWGFPVLPAEIERWPSLPRLTIPAREGRSAPTTALTPRRWVVGGDALAAIRAETDETERYLAWRAELDRRDVPDRVIARWALLPDAPELILATESPFALRCLCERLPDGPATLVLSELPGPIGDWPVQGPEGHHLSELAVTWVRRAPSLDPAVFPGEVVPSTFGAILDALDALGDADPAPIPSDVIDIDGTGAIAEEHQRARFEALLDQLVEPTDRRAVAQAAAAWLSRVADAQDPAGADTPSGPPTTEPEPADQPADRRLRADLRSLRAAFDADVAHIATITGAGSESGLDAAAVRTQLVARLGHIDAVARWGEGPKHLRREASIWRALAST